MKYVICVPDGCSDLPTDMLDGRTPLEAAHMPNLDALAARGTVGRAAVIPDGLPPGSDVGNMSILGYDPSQFHTGRSPIEAAALGLRLGEDQVAFRCNLVTVGPDGTMLDFAAGHPDNETAAQIIKAVDTELGDDTISFHPGVSYRHTMVAPAALGDVVCTPPHDITGQPMVLPAGTAAGPIGRLIEASASIVGQFETAATHIWLWGQGPQPVMTPFHQLFGRSAGLVTAVDLVRGLGVLTQIEVHEAEGATAWFDTNYENKCQVALDGLAAGLDLFLIHVEATDEAGHAGNAEEKVRALENWDSRIFPKLVEGLDAMGDWRMLVMPDHATPLDLRTHVPDPVPYLLVDSRTAGPGGVYTEAGVASAAVVPGHALMGRLLEVEASRG
ncbi:MAG: 2,3-bisphosphoglycerate-independent phosphoglycerate mutase [Acidimicrobiales bacterium]|nr:2,3-bisphosphoglycerate-independent phosphoglycerate mutase [Acidimicrobiales bacterium]